MRLCLLRTRAIMSCLQRRRISWKKTQKRNPKADPEVVEKKTGNHGLAGKPSR